MELIENQEVSGKTIAIDEKHFVNCKYKNCTLIYSGGDFSWVNTTFEACQISLAGSAQRTANFLGSFGIIPPSGTQVQNNTPTFGFVKKPDGKVN